MTSKWRAATAGTSDCGGVTRQTRPVNANRAHWYAMPRKRAILGHFARFRGASGCDSVRPSPFPPDAAMKQPDLAPLLYRIADALERLAPAPVVNRVALGLLRGIDRVRDILLENTERFAGGLPANNVLLWGARGTGKSALVKAAHAAVNEARPAALALVEIHREDIPSLPRLLSLARASTRRCLLFCDDLSFEKQDTSYKSLKAV